MPDHQALGMESRMKNSPKAIRIEDYDYPLPAECIAKFPLDARDQSKLLLYQNGQISHTIFQYLPEYLPDGALLVFNDTKVIHARMQFILENNSQIEILCLEPLVPHDYQQNFSSFTPVRWKCLVGNNRKWKSGELIKQFDGLEINGSLTVRRIQPLEDAFEIEFSWDNVHSSFGEILAKAGIMPLPPYLNRENVVADEERYQTIYAQAQGSVAAPTAGLHFTNAVFDHLNTKGIEQLFVTLHVGAGTFKPVKTALMADHHMHEESVFVQRAVIEKLLEAKHAQKPIVAVGTTSMRTLESLYWCGVQLLQNKNDFLNIQQWRPYEVGKLEVSTEKSLQTILDYLKLHQKDTLAFATQLLIAPGYAFKVVDGLITNFHQPKSTLLLLVAALVGQDWRKIYDYALANAFRFLSYGDTSLLMKSKALP